MSNNVLEMWRDNRLEVAVGLGVLYFSWQYVTSPSRKLNAKPICWPWPFAWLDFAVNGRKRLFSAYAKHVKQSGSFTVPYIGNTMVVVTGKLVEELRAAPEGDLSFKGALADLYLIKYTLGPDVVHDPLHTPVLKYQLPKNVHDFLPDLLDELMYSIDHLLDIKPEQGWVKMKPRDVLLKIISAASNRVFLGLAACRSPEFRDLQVNYALQVVFASRLIYFFPWFLHPIVGPLISPAKSAVKTASKYVAPLMAERQHMDPASRPNDLVTWCMNYAESRGEEITVEETCLRILAAGVAAIHTTGTSMTQAVVHLAARQQTYLGPLREEVEAAVAKHGWNKAALGEMKKIDSFLKESHRWSVSNAAVLIRKAKRDYTYSDGTFVPKGYLTCTLSTPVHHDENIYPNADEFDGFRFVDAGTPQSSATASSSQLTSTSLEYLAFGHGVHSCPGRFMATYELKFILAYLVMHYDMRMEREGVRPDDFWVGSQCFPNLTAQVMFRRRED